MKAVPTFVIAFVLVLRRVRSSKPLYPSSKAIGILVVAALVMQFGGNLGFQMALGHIGLAVSVPLVFAMIITTGAFFGKIFLGDTVTPRTMLSIVLMMTAIVVLSYAATLASAEKPTAVEIAKTSPWLGILIAVISGTSYGVNGVIIRRSAQKSISVEAVLLVYSVVGVVALAIPGAAMMGTDGLRSITLHEWHMMFWAGTFNALAFFAVTWALKLANITLVNVVNATQNAMCAVAAVLLFNEPRTNALIVGVVLSMCGLAVLYRRRPV